MTATSPNERFTMLPSGYLASRPPASEITMQHLLETQQRLAEEAREALPYAFDECTYPKGYLRQSVWSCLDCSKEQGVDVGVCYGCSISCHSEHKLVELWTRRHFRCDCPTSSCSDEAETSSSSSSRRKRRCALTQPDRQPQERNEENRYSKNFKGEFCRCGRVYDAETEVEAMLNCMGCEDWFHESCLNLRQPMASRTADVKSQDPSVAVEGAEDDDDEREVLIPSETYDGLICAACVEGNASLRDRAGKDGWMIIEPLAGTTGYGVIGRASVETIANTSPVKATIDSDSKTGEKRSALEDASSEPERPKRVKLELDSSDKPTWTWVDRKGKGDVFLADGIREKLQSSLNAASIASLPFSLLDEEIYEPPRDTAPEDEETLDQVTSRVIGSLPRVQAIEALHGYARMKDGLQTLLADRAARGETVTKEDIQEFFSNLRGSA